MSDDHSRCLLDFVQSASSPYPLLLPVLSDPQKRSIYDTRGEAGLSESSGMGGMDPQSTIWWWWLLWRWWLSKSHPLTAYPRPPLMSGIALVRREDVLVLVLAGLVHVLVKVPILLLGLLVDWLSLSAGLTTSYVLGAPQQSVISTNKEGLVSCNSDAALMPSRTSREVDHITLAFNELREVNNKKLIRT
ncbi:hypothetical protein EDB85DRAFT_1899923 [Lactarius pseudohatsudake]|nr:hypothetical protein EDB85DRAFT_1899923 [Lactarius pseudohatsudake]